MNDHFVSDEFDKKINDCRQLLKISAYLHSTLNLETLIERSIKTAKEVLGGEEASLMLWSEEKQHLYFFHIQSSAANKLKELTLKKGEGIAGYVLEKGTPLIIADAENDPRLSKKGDDLSKMKTSNMLCAPLISEDKAIGVIEIINKKTGAFTEEDLFLCSSLADIIAAAIDNANLHKKVKEDLDKIRELESSKTNFISVLSHELKTPLTSIRGYVDLLSCEDTSQDEQKEYEKIITRETNRLNSLVGDIFVVNDIDDLRNNINPEEIDICAQTREIMNFWKESAPSHTFTLELDKEIFPIKADKEKTAHCLNHLIDNAVKFSPNGGDIIIRIKTSETGVEISIKDCGIGIAPEYYEKIFDKFYQVDSSSARCFEGMGNGLYICNKIAQAHNGAVTLESELGKGSVFTLRLPAP